MLQRELLSDGYGRILAKINQPHVDVVEVTTEVLGLMIDLFGADKGEIVLFRDGFHPDDEDVSEEATVRCSLHQGFTEEQRKKLGDTGILRRSVLQAVKEKQSRVVTDTTDEEDSDRDMSRLLANGSWMNHVLQLNGQAVALIHLAHRDAGRFKQEDLKELESVSLLLATALNLSRLWEHERKHMLDLIKTLNRLVEAKDEYTAGHVERVKNYSGLMCSLLNLSTADRHLIETAAYLHDIGKVGIADSILKKSGPLTPEEKKIMMQHVDIGDSILDHLPFLDEARRLASLHHEYMDGTGHHGGNVELPVGARIISIADAWDALTTTRPYRQAMFVEDAILVVTDPEIKQWDPGIVQTFVDHLSTAEFLDFAIAQRLIIMGDDYERDHSVLRFKNFHQFYIDIPSRAGTPA